MAPGIDAEKRTVELMVRMYCRHKEGNRELCDECRAVVEYAGARLSRCRFGDGKPTCRLCPVHCYRPDMRQRIREIMRYSGPRMLLYHPVEAVRHVVRELINKGKVKR